MFNRIGFQPNLSFFLLLLVVIGLVTLLTNNRLRKYTSPTGRKWLWGIVIFIVGYGLITFNLVSLVSQIDVAK